MATMFENVRITDITLFQGKPSYASLGRAGIAVMDFVCFSTAAGYGTCTVVVSDHTLHHGGEDGLGLDVAATLEEWGMELEPADAVAAPERLPYHAVE